jgi:hypothetical protein
MQASPRIPRRSDASILLAQLAGIFWPLVLGNPYVYMLCNAHCYLYQLLAFVLEIYIWDFLIYICNGFDMMWDLVMIRNRLSPLFVLAVSVYLTVCFSHYICFDE